MDLAAERGTEWLVVQRERFWEALSADERERAVREGRALYAEFGDPAATPRLERELRAGHAADRQPRRLERRHAQPGPWRWGPCAATGKAPVGALLGPGGHRQDEELARSGR